MGIVCVKSSDLQGFTGSREASRSGCNTMYIFNLFSTDKQYGWVRNNSSVIHCMILILVLRLVISQIKVSQDIIIGTETGLQTTDWRPEALWFKSHYGPKCPDQLWGPTHPPTLLFNG